MGQDQISNQHKRLGELVHLSCGSDETIVRGYKANLAAGETPSFLELLNISVVLDRVGEHDLALKLRRSHPESAVWYAERGRVAIEREQNEPRAIQYFKLADQIDSDYDARKISMYMYLCLAAVRDSEVRVRQDPCSDFDRADRSGSSALLLGRFHYQKGEYVAASNHLERAANLAPDLGDTYYWLGLTQAAVGDKLHALRTFQDGTQKAPLYVANYLEVARLQAGFACYNEARSALQQLQSLPVKGALEAAQDLLREFDGKQDDCHLPVSVNVGSLNA